MTRINTRPAWPLKLSVFCAAALVAALVALQLPSSAETRFTAADPGDPRNGTLTAAPPKRHLILLGGGGFTRYDPNFERTMVPAASRHGFEPHYVRYRLNDFVGAVQDARAEARRLTNLYGKENVFAFGSSAGGTLALILAGEARISAAVASSALYDFNHWPWVNLYWGKQYFDEIRLDAASRRQYSPMHRPLRCPALAMHGTVDPVVSFFQAEDFAAAHQRATTQLYFGGHGLYGRRPQTVGVGMRWLARTARIQARESVVSRPTPYAGPAVRQIIDRRTRRFRANQAENLCSAPRQPPIEFTRRRR